MPRLLVFAVVVILGCAATAAAQQAPSTALDYDFFKARIQPVFTTKRAGNARCVSCHSSGTPMRLQPLAPGAATWSEEDSRKNFELVKSRVIAGKPEISRLLRHPLAESAGGDPHHDGGKHWATKDDPEWQTLAAWVAGAARAARLVLVKPVAGLYREWPPAGAPIAELTVDELAGLHPGGVDAHLPVALRAAGVEAWIVDGREPARLAELLARGHTAGTWIVAPG